MREKLRLKRQQAGLSLKAVADAMGIWEKNYGRIERSETDGRLSTWKAIQKVYGIPDSKMWEYMIDGTEEEE